MRNDIIDELKGLAVHYPRIVRNEDDEIRWLKAYLDDLNDLPIEAIRKGCIEWRRSAARKFPGIGELLAACRKHVPERRSTVEKWQEIGDDEYRALSLTEKIRYLTILAGECQMKAGAQTKPREEMSEDWQRWNRRAADHLAEVAILRKVLTEKRFDAA